MIQSFRPGTPLAVLLLAVALPAMAGATNANPSQAPAATPPSAPAQPAEGCHHASLAGAGSWNSFVLPWTVLPSRFEDWSWTALRVEWDPESQSWGVASPDAASASVFGARLPSDRPIQITRPDGTVMLVGHESMEYLTVERGADGRFHHRCGQDPSPSVPAMGWPEK